MMNRTYTLGLVLSLTPACGDDGGTSTDTSGGTETATMTAGTASTTPTTATTMPTATTMMPTTATTEPSTSGMTADTGDSTTVADTGSSSSDSTGALAPVATAMIVAKSGSNVMGTANFYAEGDQIRVEFDISMAPPPGDHGIHIHETGDCSDPDGASAGSHWNPAGADHGAFESGHLGDLGNITIDANGNGTLSLTTTQGQWAVGGGGDDDLLLRAIILHEFEDDLSATPNPGPRIGCGEITTP